MKKPKEITVPFTTTTRDSFSIIMLALVDGEYKVRWVDAGRTGSFSDAQIFNSFQLKAKIEDGTIGFPTHVKLHRVIIMPLTYSLADDAFSLKTWFMEPYGKRMMTRVERVANYRMSC